MTNWCLKNEWTPDALNRCCKREPPVSVATLNRTATASTQLAWRPPPEIRALADGEIHVWRACLDGLSARSKQFAPTLSPDELARAERFRFERDKMRFVAGRGLLRLILSHYSDIPAGQLVFSYGPRGKPRLLSASGEDLLYFNVAHSDRLALFAVTRAGEVGIDVECVRPVGESEQIASRFFSERECNQWRSLPARLQTEAFFNCWTRKEAYLKANGEGIADSLKQVEVSLIPREPAQLLCLAGDRGAAANWRLQALIPALGYVGALAARAG